MKAKTKKQAKQAQEIIQQADLFPEVTNVKSVKAKKKKGSEEKELKAKNKDKKVEVIQDVIIQQKEGLLEEVVSKREVKYLYPEDLKDTLQRKSWRQKVRNELRKRERKMFRIQDENSKEYKEAKKEYIQYKNKYLKESVEVF